MRGNSLRGRQFLLSTTMLVAALSGYGRRAYGACVAGTPPDFVCSGANNTQQTITFDDATVSTVPGFSVVTLDPRAVQISGDGALSYTDLNASPLTAAATALYVQSNGDIAGGNPGSVTINTNGALTGGDFGISAVNRGKGAMSVTANGDVTGTNATGYGIYARNRGNGLDITTGPGSTVTGGDTGISAENLGTGDMTVALNGDVTGTNSTGAELFNFQFGNDVVVTTAAGTTISGLGLGLRASNNGSGDTTINVNGDVASTSGGTGLYGVNFSNARDISITTAVGTNVTGSAGIFSRSFGSGDMSITVNGDVTGTGSSGIEVRNYADDVTVNTGTTSTVTGAFFGIQVRNNGTGALAVNANGDVTGVNNYGRGIEAVNNAGTDLSITTGVGADVAGGIDGIRARNYGSGHLWVATNGDVTGRTRTGIYALNGASGTDLRVTTGAGTTVTGVNYGIRAFNSGSGALTITADGNTSSGFVGIEARNSANGTGLSVTSNGTVSGPQFGIRARNDGTGATSVIANGDVTSNNFGIYARNTANGADLGVAIGDGAAVTAGSTGILARNYAGDLSVITGVNSTVTGTTYAGVIADNRASGANLIVTTGAGSTTTGNKFGISAKNAGTGALSVTANGDVTGTTDIGIYALNTGSGTDLGVTTSLFSNVTGGFNGIVARNEGTGAANVIANGVVYGGLFDGIFAANSANGTDLSVTSGAFSSVTGLANGMNVRNYGGGALTVTADGDVNGVGSTVTGIGPTGVGIYAQNFAGTDLTVTTGASSTVTGSNHGIFARNYGTGAFAVTAYGETTGDTFDGIYARQGPSGTSLSVTTGAGATTGGRIGIAARNYGSGALTVTADGDVAGNNSDGVYARQSTAGAGLSVTTAASVSGGRNGISARNYGAGALAVIANGDTTGDGGVGVYARNFAGGTNLSVTANTVTGNIDGIRAYNDGTGATSIIANGDVNASFHAIYVKNNSTATDLSVTTGAGSSVTGEVGGIRAFNDGTGALRVMANGDVTGLEHAGIYARHSNGGPIDVTVGAGATAQGAATGVRIAGGSQNSLTNFGTVRNLDGIVGTAIIGGIGNETVNNFGLVTGDVLLGTGINAFNNFQSGLFESGADVSVGAGNALTNSGSLSPGGAGSVLTTALTGNFVQTSPGSFLVDIQGANADRVDATGSASVNGKIKPNYTLKSLGSNTEWTVLTATTPIVDNGIKAVSTPVVQFGVDFPTATQMDLVLLGVNFAVKGLNRNQTAIADNLTAIFDTGKFAGMNSALNAIAALPNTRAIANALNALSPEVYLDTEISTLYAALSFTNTLMTCPVYGGANAFIKEGQCVWARASGQSFDQDTTLETLGINETSFQVAGGAQGAFGDAWRLGFAGAIEQGRLDTSTLAQSDFDRAHAGAVLKYNPGALLLAGAVSGGWGWYETTRPIVFPGFSSLATSDHDVNYVNGRFRAAYLFTNGQWYAKPMADFDATRISLDHLSESASGGVGLNVRGNDETVLSATPALELGVQFGAEGGTLFRPYVRGGATFFDDPNFVLLSSFEGSPSGVAPFRIATETADVVAVVAAGIDVVGASGASFRLYYDGRFGDGVETNEGGIKATLAF